MKSVEPEGFPRPTNLAFGEYVAQYIRDSSDFMEGIRRGLLALREGKVRPWKEVKRELGR